MRPHRIAGFVAVFLLLYPLVRRVWRRYVVVPWRMLGDPMAAEPRPTSIDDAAVPTETAAAFAAAAAHLAPLGFVRGLLARAMETIPGAESYLAVWVHPRNAAVAQVMSVRINRHGRRGRTRNVISLHTRFADGGGVEIGNPETPGVFVPNRAVDSVRWPGMTNVTVMYYLHARRVERLRDGRDSVPAPPPEPAVLIQWLRDQHQRTVRRQLDAGYYWHDEPAGVYRKTLKGTFLMTWKLLWPWKQLRLGRHARKLRRELANYPDLKIIAHPAANPKVPGIHPETLARLEREKLQNATPPA